MPIGTTRGGRTNKPGFASLARSLGSQRWWRIVPSRLPTTSGLRTVLLRYACFAASTSKVEQSFSQIANVLGAARLNATDTSEEQSIALLLFDAAAIGCGEGDLFERAAEVWAVAFPAGARQHGDRRADVGSTATARPIAAGAKLSETQFLKRSHDAVGAAAPAGAAEVLNHQPEVWSHAGAREEAFQAEKRRKRQIEEPGPKLSAFLSLRAAPPPFPRRCAYLTSCPGAFGWRFAGRRSHCRPRRECCR